MHFGTFRKSDEVALAWRRNVALDKALNVQDACAEGMDAMGYKRVSEEGELRDKNFEIVKQREEVAVLKK